MELMMPHEHVGPMRGALSAKAGTHSLSVAVDATRADALRPFALYYLKLIDTAKGAGMGEASPIEFVLGTKPGTMIVRQPDILAPVLINLPLPVWATCGEEVDDQDLDKAARAFAGKF